MGSSGAGKTTLLDVLGGRKTAGYIEGDIKINGEDALKGQFSRLMGYVEQDDIHNAFTTVREALEFSAKLRLPKSVSKDLRSKFVDEVIDLLELRSVQNRLIGEGGANSISRGELKLLTIGVELVTNPSLLFLDEPTMVRNISRTGRTVVCTIHQPSAELFFMFDRLLLLKRGGEEVYFGPVGYEGADLVRYLESVPNVNKKPARLNPASWMLDVIGAGTGSRDDPGAHKALEVVRSEEESEAKETPVAVDAEGSSGEIREALAKYLDTANRVGTAKEEDFPPFYHASALCAENVRETKASLEPPADEALSGK
ncbi:ABCG36, partial [Symbiodinium sp. KB8]